MKREEIKQLLRDNNFRAAPKRVDILFFLAEQKKPLSVDTLCKQFPSINKTTIYRMLEAMVEVNILSKHDLGHGHYDYEFSPNGRHHHHLVCSDCNKIEEVDLCKNICHLAIEKSENFAEITQHMVTIFGKCKKCVS